MTTKVQSRLPLHNDDASSPPRVYNKFISIGLFALAPVIMTMFVCDILALRGIPLGFIVITLWENVTHTVPEDAPSFWRTLFGTVEICIFGADILGVVIGLVLSTYCLLIRYSPINLGPQRILPVMSSARETATSWQYRGDKPSVICAGVFIGSAAVPALYLAMRCFGWDTGKAWPSDPTRPFQIASLGAVCGTIVEALRDRAARAEAERKLAEEAAEAASKVVMVRWAAGAEMESNTSVV